MVWCGGGVVGPIKLNGMGCGWTLFRLALAHFTSSHYGRHPGSSRSLGCLHPCSRQGLLGQGERLAAGLSTLSNYTFSSGPSTTTSDSPQSACSHSLKHGRLVISF